MTGKAALARVEAGPEIPPAARTGWPWTDAADEPAVQVPVPAPRISVITVNYNHAEFLEQAIRSVLFQRYPNLEFIVVDGGSTDASVDVLGRYAPWLAWWTSERDRGPAHAVNKAFARVTGEIVGWLPSTDVLMPHALGAVAHAWRAGAAAVLYGRCGLVSTEGEWIRDDAFSAAPPPTSTWDENLAGPVFALPGLFFPGAPIVEGWRLDERLSIVTDWEFALRLLRRYPGRHVGRHLAAYRTHEARVSDDPARMVDEAIRVLGRLAVAPDMPFGRRARVLDAAGRFLIRKSELLRERGQTLRGLVAGAAGYAVEWRQWRRRARAAVRRGPGRRGGDQDPQGQ